MKKKLVNSIKRIRKERKETYERGAKATKKNYLKLSSERSFPFSQLPSFFLRYLVFFLHFVAFSLRFVVFVLFNKLN